MLNCITCFYLDIDEYLNKDFMSNILYLLSRHKQTDMISPIIREGELSQCKSVWSEAVWQKKWKGTE